MIPNSRTFYITSNISFNEEYNLNINWEIIEVKLFMGQLFIIPFTVEYQYNRIPYLPL